MPDFVLSRNHSMRTLFGHIVEFKKGQPTHVPPICVKDAVAIGALPVDGEIDVLDPELPEPIFMTPEERQENIIAAFKLLEDRGGREDFTASGCPTREALVKILGFATDKKEYEALWTGYTAEKNVAE
jgi:hypothetical protein